MALDTHLVAAIAALEAGDPARALAPLLAAWRAQPLEPIAAALGQVSERASQDRALDPAEGHHRAWLRLAGREDPADVGVLLQTLAGAPAHLMRERVTVLAERGADPRVERALLAWLALPTLRGPAGRELALAMLDVLAKTPSPDTAKAVAALREDHHLGGMGRRVTRRLDQVAGALASAPPKVRGASDQALLAKLRALAAPAASGTGEAELLAAVHANPADDRPRLVYADWLLERGDPRGEFIVLQCRRAGEGGRPTKRERELERTHAAKWLQPLTAILPKKYLAFERGFLAACGVSVRWTKDRELLGHPMFSTVTRFDLSACDPEWVNHRACGAVDTVTGLTFSNLPALTRQVRHLGLEGFDSLEHLPRLREQRRLETVEIVALPAAVDWAAQTLRPWLPPSVKHFTLDGKRFSPT